MIKKAYSLLEAIVAISVVTVIITASVTVINTSLQSLDENGSYLMATNFNLEAIGYFERIVKTNKLRFPGRVDCKFVPLSLDNCEPAVEGGVLVDGSYDLSFNTDKLDYEIIASEGALDNLGGAGINFDSSQLNSYQFCNVDKSLAGGDLDDTSCVYFYSSEELENADRIKDTKFVRVIQKNGDSVTSSVYFFVVGKTGLEKIELSANL